MAPVDTDKRTHITDPEYLRKRERNNIAVKESRKKAKERNDAMRLKINELRSDNEVLESRISNMTEELEMLKRQIVERTNSTYGIGIDLNSLLNCDTMNESRLPFLNEPSNSPTSSNDFMSTTSSPTDYAASSTLAETEESFYLQESVPNGVYLVS